MATESGFTVFVNVLKITLAVVVMVGIVGAALWYSAHAPALEQARQEVSAKAPNSSTSDKSWGIAHDSPLRRK